MAALDKKTLLGFALSFALLMLAGLLSYRSVNQLLENAAKVSHTHELLHSLKSMLSDVQDIETGQRGFVITGKEEYLQPYTEGLNTIRYRIGAVKELTSANPDQQARIARIAEYIENKIEICENSIKSRRRDGVEAASLEISSGEGRKAMDRIRDAIGAMIADESVFLEQRQKSEYAATKRTIAIVALGGLIACAIAGVSVYSMRRDILARLAAEQALTERSQFFSTALTSIGDAVIATDHNGCITFMNPVAEELTQWTADLAGGKSMDLVFDIFDESTRKPVENPVRAVLRSGETVALAHRTILRSRHGNEIPIEDSAAPIRNNAGVLTGVVLVFRDATESLEREKAQIAARAYAENIVDTIRAPLVVLDASLNVVSANRAFHSTFELTVGETVQQNFFQPGRAWSDDAALRNRLERIIPEDSSFENYLIETEIPGIGWKSLDLNARKIFRPGNHTGMILLVLEDVTSIRKAESALREQSMLHEAVLSSANSIIISVRLDGKIQLFNAAAERMLGYKADEVIGRATPEIIHDADEIARRAASLSVEMGIPIKPGFETFVAKARHGFADSNEWTYIHKDGTRFPVLLSVTALRHRDGNISGFLGVATDISARKQAELSLEHALAETSAAHDQVDAIVRSVAHGLLVTDLDDRVIIMNETAERLLGIRSADVLGKPLSAEVPDALVGNKIRSALARKEIGGKFDISVHDANGKACIMQARTSIVRDKAGKSCGIVTVVEDVTHEREVNRMKTEFLSTAAHELRTPLTSIRGFSEILMTRNLPDDKRKHFLETINTQSTNLANLVNDLLDLARIESGRGIALRRAPTDLMALTRELIEGFIARGVPHKYIIESDSSDFRVYCDRDRMRQVFQNVLSNGTKYSPRGGDIHIRFSSVNALAVVEFIDQGIGMSSEQITRVFERFYRADASNTAVEGTGLGMSIVKAIVEQHGGAVAIRSVAGQGTVVTIKLPAGVPSGTFTAV